VMVGELVTFDPLNAVGLERHRLKNLLEDTIRSMYLRKEHNGGSEVAALTPQHK